MTPPVVVEFSSVNRNGEPYTRYVIAEWSGAGTAAGVILRNVPDAWRRYFPQAVDLGDFPSGIAAKNAAKAMLGPVTVADVASWFYGEFGRHLPQDLWPELFGPIVVAAESETRAIMSGIFEAGREAYWRDDDDHIDDLDLVGLVLAKVIAGRGAT